MKIDLLAVGPMQVNCYIVRGEESEKAIVIDPGEQASKIKAKLDELGLSCSAILLTHGHFDHITGVEALKTMTGAQVLAGRDEAELLNDSDLNVSERVRKPVTVVPDRLLGDMEEVSLEGLKFKTIYTPGHTQGSVCYYFEKEGVIFTGDTLFKSGFGRTDLPTGNEKALFGSIVNRLFVLPPDTRCYPGHGEATDIASEGLYFGS